MHEGAFSYGEVYFPGRVRCDEVRHISSFLSRSFSLVLGLLK